MSWSWVLLLCGCRSCFGGTFGSAKGAWGCFGLRAGAGTLSLYPARASAALDPVRGNRPLTHFFVPWRCL